MASGLGSGVEANWQALCAGYSAVTGINHFDTSAINFHLAAVLADLRESKNNRVQQLTRMALNEIGPLPQQSAVIWTGIKGNAQFIESGLENGMLHLASDYRKWVQSELGLTGNGLEVNAACASSTAGIALAAQKIALGMEKTVLITAADQVSRFVHFGFSALKALTPSLPRPFDQHRDGLVLGDGSCSLVLMDEATAAERNLTPLAEIAGWGIANDANHITGPARDACGLIAAIEKALGGSELSVDRVQAFCAHGTATDYNDGMELTAVASLFGDRPLPVFSVKGAIGHTLGAAGGIETILYALALREQKVPPTIGFEAGDQRTRGRVSAEVQNFAGQNILTTNSGFGGVNAALILKRVE